MRTALCSIAPAGLVVLAAGAHAATADFEPSTPTLVFRTAPNAAGWTLGVSSPASTAHSDAWLSIDLDDLNRQAQPFGVRFALTPDALTLGESIAIPTSPYGASPMPYLFAFASPSVLDSFGDLDALPRPGGGGNETVVPIPTPLAATLAGAGLAGVVGSRRRATR